MVLHFHEKILINISLFILSQRRYWGLKFVEDKFSYIFLWYASIAPLALCYWTVNGGLWVHTFAVKRGFISILIYFFYSEAYSRCAIVGRTSKTMVLPWFYRIKCGGQSLLGRSSSGRSGRLLVGPFSWKDFDKHLIVHIFLKGGTEV